jgi:hypothetical protein
MAANLGLKSGHQWITDPVRLSPYTLVVVAGPDLLSP